MEGDASFFSHRAWTGTLQSRRFDRRVIGYVGAAEMVTPEGSHGGEVSLYLDYAGVDAHSVPFGLNEQQARGLGEALIAAANIARDHPTTLPPVQPRLAMLSLVQSEQASS
ncbi:MAG: hypothetical protein JWP14_2764 [Frankiales bacterium]|nr:hypothetical protein [Frankiales bacterium]